MSYLVAVVCENCGWNDLMGIRDGELIELQKCPVCKCQRITKVRGKSASRVEIKRIK